MMSCDRNGVCILEWLTLSRIHSLMGPISRGRDLLSIVILCHPISGHMFLLVLGFYSIFCDRYNITVLLMVLYLDLELA